MISDQKKQSLGYQHSSELDGLIIMSGVFHDRPNNRYVEGYAMIQIELWGIRLAGGMASLSAHLLQQNWGSIDGRKLLLPSYMAAPPAVVRIQGYIREYLKKVQAKELDPGFRR